MAKISRAAASARFYTRLSCLHLAAYTMFFSDRLNDQVTPRRATRLNKYRLSLVDPRDRIVLWTELDDLCDKLQRSTVGARRHCQLI